MENELFKKLEELNDEFVLWNLPHDHTYGRIPGEEEVRLWQIPRSTGEFLCALVKFSTPKIILEIGTSAGYSALWLAEGAKEFGGEVYTIEILQEKIDLAHKFISESKLENINIIEGDAIEKTGEFNKNIDFLFLDADKENYAEYFKKLRSRLKPGCIIVADNAGDYGHLMKNYFQVIREDPNVENLFLPIDNGLMISVIKRGTKNESITNL